MIKEAKEKGDRNQFQLYLQISTKAQNDLPFNYMYNLLVERE